MFDVGERQEPSLSGLSAGGGENWCRNEMRIVRRKFPGKDDHGRWGAAIGACMVTQQDAGRWPEIGG